MMENCRERNFYFTNLAADICLPKMVAELLSHPKRQFHRPENNRHAFWFFLHYENSRWHRSYYRKCQPNNTPPNRYAPKLAVWCPWSVELRVYIYRPGWRETIWSKVSKNTTSQHVKMRFQTACLSSGHFHYRHWFFKTTPEKTVLRLTVSMTVSHLCQS